MLLNWKYLAKAERSDVGVNLRSSVVQLLFYVINYRLQSSLLAREMVTKYRLQSALVIKQLNVPHSCPLFTSP